MLFDIIKTRTDSKKLEKVWQLFVTLYVSIRNKLILNL